MNNKLNIRLYQADIVWQDAELNIKKLEKQIPTLKKVDILICPEMYTTGFSMSVQNCAEKFPGASTKSIIDIAKKSNTAIVCSLIVSENGEYFNRLLFVFPDGKYEYYDKRHLFTMGEEDKYYTAGTKRLIIDYKGWKICPLICYDLRFPVWSRNDCNYDLLIYVANWPDSRRDVWNTLLRARAIENQTYVVGVNRVGKDGMGLKYSGDSILINAKGQDVLSFKQNEESYKDVEIDKTDLINFRDKFPVLNDRDDFTVNI